MIYMLRFERIPEGVLALVLQISIEANIERLSNDTIVKSEKLRLNLKSFQGLNSSSVSRSFEQNPNQEQPVAR